ncbi:uncharacterized protein alms1 [Polypterus senegalus]|uniref:uncharacterized protein alms1 n=1 Tax=Polypterus senegalus TaxID=55291 RepID=UPI0019640688|nr:uncharacterized protein alms1 [Polypterus senegalus]
MDPLEENETDLVSSAIMTTPPLMRNSRPEELLSQSSSPGSGTQVSSASGFSLGEAIVQRAKQGLEPWYQLQSEEDFGLLPGSSVTLPSEHTATYGVDDLPSLEEGFITMTKEPEDMKGKDLLYTPKLDYQDSFLSPALPLLTQYSDGTLFEQTNLEFAPLRPLPDNSYMTEEFPGPLQLNPALQLATTDVFPDSVSSGPLSQCPLMMSTFDPDDEKNINIILPQHQLSHRSVLEEQVERELREECELSLVGQEEFSNCSESQVHEEKGGQKSESNDQALHEELPRASMADDVSFLDSDIPVPLLLELLEKEVGVSSSGTCSAVSTSSSHAELPSRNLEKYETVPLDTDRVVSPNVINDTIANSVAQGFTFSSSELPANIIRDQPVVGNVVQSFDSSNGQKEKNELNVFNASDVSYVTAKQESAKSNENKVDVDSHDTYSGRASTVIEFPTDLSKGSLDCSVERGFKEGELSSSAHQTNVDSSVFGLPLKPISQSTPGMFLGAPKSTVQYNLSKGTTNQSKKECSLDKLSPIQSKQEMLVLSTSTSLDITPKALLNSSTGKELPEPTPETNSSSTGKCSNEQSLFVNKKFQSLPALNYMEKVGAWNMTFPTSKTEFDNLALRGFTGVSPRQKAYSAIADSLNQLLSRKNSTKSFSPSTSDNSKSPKKSLSSSFCGNLSPATDFLENKGSLTNSPLARSWSCTSIKEEQLALDQKQDDVLCQNIEGAEKITKCLPDNIVLTRVLNSCRKEDSQEKVAEKMASDKDHGNLVKNNILSSDSASCNLDILLQPVEHEHHHCEGGPPNRFSDESPNETVGTLVSFQDANYKDVNSLHASYDVSAVSPPNNLQTDSYASHCATNPSTPVKNVEFNIEERIPHYLRALGIDQSPSTILTPFAPRGPIREPEFSPTDLCTIKGSTCTQQSEGDSPLKGDFSQSSILSINSTLSLSVPLGSDADSETPLPSEPAITNDFRTSVERPVSQCSPHVDFHPIDHSLDIPLQKSCSSGSESSKLNSEESLARFTQKQSPSVIGRLVSENFQNNINNFDSGHPSAPDNLPSISLLASDHQTEVMNSPTLNLSSGSLLTKESHAEMNNSILNSSESSSGRIASETSFQNLNIDNDSFEGAKTLKEIRKLLSKTEEPPFPRSSFSSPSASLRGSEDISAYLYKGLDNFNFQGSLASHFDVNDNGSYWHKSSSSSTLSLLTLDGLKESLIFDGCFSTRSSSPSSFISQGKKSIQSKRQEKIDSLTESKQVGHEYGQGGSFIADSVKRFEPEGCSEARQINASFASTMSFAAPSLELDDVQENPEDIAQETPETIFLPSTVTEMIGIDESHETVKVIEGSDRSSANSIASQVAFLLKTESPVTSASSIINAANEEEAKARDLTQLKLAGDYNATLELNMEDRQRIEEIKAELLQNTKLTSDIERGQWISDSDSDVTSATGQFCILPTLPRPQVEALSLVTSSQTSLNPSDMHLESPSTMCSNVGTHLHELGDRDGISGRGVPWQITAEAGRPISSITFSSRKRSPSPSVSPSRTVKKSSEPQLKEFTFEEKSSRPKNHSYTEPHRARKQTHDAATEKFIEQCHDNNNGKNQVSFTNGLMPALNHYQKNNSSNIPTNSDSKEWMFSPRSQEYRYSNKPLQLDEFISQQDKVSRYQQDVSTGVYTQSNGYGPRLVLRSEAFQERNQQEHVDTQPSSSPKHVFVQSPKVHIPESTINITKNISRSTPNLSLREDTSPQVKSQDNNFGTTPMQISTVASGTSYVSSPTRKVLSYVHLTFTPKPSSGNLVSSEDSDIKFASEQSRSSNNLDKHTFEKIPQQDCVSAVSEIQILPNSCMAVPFKAICNADAESQTTTFVPQQTPLAPTTTSSTKQDSQTLLSQSRALPITSTSSSHVSNQPILGPYKPLGISDVPNTSIANSHSGQQSIIPSKLMELHEDKETQVSMRSTQGMSSQRSIPASPWEQKGLISAGLKKSRVFENADLSRKSSEDANSIPSSHNIIQPFVRTTYKTVEVQTDEQQFAVDEPDFARIMDKNRRNAQKCEMAYSIGNLHDHLSSRRKSPTSTRADNSIRSQSTTSHMTHSGYYHDGYHAKHSQSLDRSLQSSKSLDQLWEKFKQRQHQEKSADTSTGEPTLLERLERLSRLLQHPTRHSELCKEEYSSIRDDGGKRPLSLQIQKEERRDLDKRKKQAWVKSFPDSKSIQTSPHAKHGMVFETDSDLGTLHETSSESMQFPQKYLTSDETAESSNSVITSETDTAAQTESNFSAPADTSSSVSTINTSRLIRAFGPEKVVVNPYLSKLYHTIDKQKENLEKRTQNRTSKASRKPLTSSATFSGNKMVSNPLPTVETSCKPSHHQKNKKPTVLVHKSIQAGHFEIVSNATKKNTKDVGMTFPSPDSDSGPHTRFSAEARNEEASHNRLLFERSEHPRVFLYEKKRKNRQRHPRGVSWFVPAVELMCVGKDRNDMQSKPSLSWFAHFKNEKSWRPPLRERHMQEEPVRNLWRETRQPSTSQPPCALVRVTLQESLELHRPDFISRSRERMKRLSLKAEERKEEALFQNEREQLFCCDAERNRLANNLRRLLDQENLSQKREITKKEMFLRSKRKYCQLPEVRKRQEEERRQAEYRCNRIKAEQYKRKIANRILGRKAPWE